eukprot:SAG31_NODE_572_length_13974_cov_28.935640_12_plen_84_part_00
MSATLQVMLVRHKENGQTFAMKVIRKDALSKKNDVEHTKTERRLLQKIKHPYIVQLHYAFQSADRLYMVMGKGCYFLVFCPHY